MRAELVLKTTHIIQVAANETQRVVVCCGTNSRNLHNRRRRVVEHTPRSVSGSRLPGSEYVFGDTICDHARRNAGGTMSDPIAVTSQLLHTVRSNHVIRPGQLQQRHLGPAAREIRHA
jgi:hypothetical protein